MIKELELKIKEFKDKNEKINKKMNEIIDENKNKEKEKYELQLKIDENINEYKKIKNNYEILNKKCEEQNKQIEIYKKM